MTKFAIIADFHLKPGSLAAFRPLIDANARSSVADEPGCQRFDVMELPDQPDRVLLYEIYDSEEAFGQHLQSPHFHRFDAASAGLIETKSITRCTLVCEG
ncbi:putative quinol monooxygenase [Paracoccus sp. (in: a-proteobacteria)]|uniref:putative quinol monooxygenase n=1 Tax=Paracoccus sp. TaxID=267 RepID=UPI003A88211C